VPTIAPPGPVPGRFRFVLSRSRVSSADGGHDQHRRGRPLACGEVVLAVPCEVEPELLRQHRVRDEIRVHVFEGIRVRRMTADSIDDADLHARKALRQSVRPFKQIATRCASPALFRPKHAPVDHSIVRYASVAMAALLPPTRRAAAWLSS
jgi:hypothetical protein